MRRVPSAGARRAGMLALALLATGCSGPPVVPALTEPAPRHLLPPDEMMSCVAIRESSRYAAARAARLNLGLATATSGTFGTGQFPQDAPARIAEEEQRLDALADLARDQGCQVTAPRRAVAAERARLLWPGPRSCIVRDGRCLEAARR